MTLPWVQRPSTIGFPFASSAVFTRLGVTSSAAKISKSGWRTPVPTGKLMKSRNVTARLSCAGGLMVESVHEKPASIVQSCAHPSPSEGLPSSQPSGGSFTPSPHLLVHVPELQSGSNVQLDAQPSASMTLWSSQASAPSRLPSPHMVL